MSELRAGAESGDAAKQYALGKAYAEGNGVPQNDQVASRWYRKAAEQGDAAAQNDLGIMYRLGQGVERNKEEAVHWYAKAAKQGNPQALFNLAVSYYNGDGVPSDPTQAYAWFLLAEEAGNPAAKEAVARSATEAGRLGTPDAQQRIAAMYEKGDGLPRNYSEAVKWYKRAAVASPEASVHLAEMLIDGRAIPHDYAEAAALCKGAAAKNYSPAKYCVGYLYEKGLGVDPNPKEAVKWYREAVEGGNQRAMMDLASMYWKGTGVRVDRAQAYYYFFLASRTMPEAKTPAALLRKEMTKDDNKNFEHTMHQKHLDPKKVLEYMERSNSPEPEKN